MRLLTMEELYKFKNIFQALAWFNNNNPARQKFPNLIEKETITTREDTSVEWAFLCRKIWDTCKMYPLDHQRAFKMRYLGSREGQMHRDHIAEKLGVRPKTVGRWIRNIREDLERVLVAAECIPPPDNSIN